MSSAQAEDGAGLDTKSGLLMAVKRRGEAGERRHGQSTSGAKVTGLACVAQATEISQAGAPVGTCSPSVSTERWHLAGAGSGRFPGG